MIRRILLFLLIFGATLVWRFPYERAIAARVSRLEATTGLRIDYRPRSASITGVEWDDVMVTSPSGVRIGFQEARLRPTFSGLSAYLKQKEGQARLTMDRQAVIDVRMDRVEMESGSEHFGNVKATGDLKHELRAQKGQGNLRLELPNFKAPLPVADLTLEIGSELFWQNRGQGYELRADIKLLGGRDFNAQGNVMIEPQPGLPARLNGSLQFQTPMRRGTLRLDGTWKQPQWTVVPQSS